MIKVKHLDKLVNLIKRVTNFRVVVDVSDYSDSDVSDEFSYSDDSEDDADSYDEPICKQKSGCGRNTAIRQLELQR